MKTTMDDLYNLFLMAGIVIAVIIGAFLGIKFMTEGVEGKAKIKEALIPFCIGCVVIFGGFGIWKVAMHIFGEVENVQETSVQEQQYFESKCAEGKHTFDNYADDKCNYCNYDCKHYTMKQEGTIMKCAREGCGFYITKCTTAYNTTGEAGKCDFVDGTCQVCGTKCKTHNWEITEKGHKCTKCSYARAHSMFEGTCVVCNYTK